ncbi:MAG: bile acid:sodium symporter family protein [Thermincolia bacterium]
MKLEKLRVVEENLLPLVVLTTAVALFLPQTGEVLKVTVSPMLALLMFFISLTFDFSQFKNALKKPWLVVMAIVLVFLPMSVVGLGIGNLLFSKELAIGQTIVGALPTDVSAPLLVYLGKGNVALASLLNGVVTGLSPFILPPLLLFLTGIEFQIPVWDMTLHMFIIIVVPMFLGVLARTKLSFLRAYEPVYSFSSSLLYLALLFVVVADSSNLILSFSMGMIILLVAGQLALNLAGYLIGFLTMPFVKNRDDLVAILFTVSKKEFSIAAALVYTAGLPEIMLIPSVIYAVLQMITSPLAVKVLNGPLFNKLEMSKSGV